MTCAEFQALSAAFALGALDTEERLAASAHLAEPHHDGCREALALAQRTVGQLAEALDDVRPPADAWRELEARITPARARDWRRGLGWAAAVVLAGVALWFARGRTRALDERAQLAQALTQVQSAQAASGPALALLQEPGSRLIHLAAQGAQRGTAFAAMSADGRRAVLFVGALPPVEGKDYELWAIPANGVPVPAGLLRARAGALATAAFATEALPGATALAVSLEPEGGAPNGKPTEVLWVGAVNG